MSLTGPLGYDMPLTGPLGYDMSLTGHHVKARNTNNKDKN